MFPLCHYYVIIKIPFCPSWRQSVCQDFSPFLLCLHTPRSQARATDLITCHLTLICIAMLLTVLESPVVSVMKSSKL